MVARNPNLARLQGGYLFPEIARRRRAFVEAHPDTQTAQGRVISLGVGNTTEPIPPHIAGGLVQGAEKLKTVEGYTGYADEGFEALRERISQVYYNGRFKADEIFISDGAKCDIGRLQLLFGRDARIVVQDPSYPVYVDGTVLIGAAGGKGSGAQADGYEGIVYLPCTAENGYFPDLNPLPKQSIFYFCSPNNPTGATITRAQLTALVQAVQKTGSLLVYDAAYSSYIRNAELPTTVYEIEGADTCAIEINSFSKSAGFTGVRLGWSVVPHQLRYADGEPVHTDWARITGTVFNGASNIAQWGGLAALDDAGLLELRTLTDFYMENARLIREAVLKLGVSCSGGDNSPYIWARFPGEDSWAVFERILQTCRVVTTPGAGFGPSGQSHIRFSAFGHRSDIEEAAARLAQL